MSNGVYRALAGAAAPALRLWLAHRQRRGKEDAARRNERFGIAARARPDGALLWVHTASLGEARSVLPLVARLLDERPGLHVLFTTFTVTSAAMLAERLPPRALHQYAPLDVPAWIGRFLDHWRPNAALWVEGELWPNLIGGLQARGVPMALVNARLSQRSFRRWQVAARLFPPPLAGFAPCLAQSARDAERLRALGATQAKFVGNLKYDGAMLPIDAMELSRLTVQFAGRPLWLAASTHPGEDEIVARAHQAIAARHPGLLTILAPRHAARGGEIEALLSTNALKVARRSTRDAVTTETDIYLADTMGELGLFYRLAGIAYIGGSLVPHGGQNPLEAAQLDCALLFGPHMHNFAEIATALCDAGGAVPIATPDELPDAVARLLADGAVRARTAVAATRIAAQGRGAIERVLVELAPMLAALPGEPTARGAHAPA
ncbi:MAG: 3-deoxy-D-manno-octulosonic acid transferase [Proteobacteria bacterium]|nr:3-deoxy-D-manno-octulosonic acid transferase [Pseudomonadota bacterium]